MKINPANKTHHNKNVCCRVSHIIRNTANIHDIIITTDQIRSLLVARLIELSASHSSGVRKAIFRSGKLRATIINISATPTQ